jgi:hypothetical protein
MAKETVHCSFSTVDKGNFVTIRYVQIAEAVIDTGPEQVNSDPVWAGSAAIFRLFIILFPGVNMVSFTTACSGEEKKLCANSTELVWYYSHILIKSY